MHMIMIMIDHDHYRTCTLWYACVRARSISIDIAILHAHACARAIEQALDRARDIDQSRSRCRFGRRTLPHAAVRHACGMRKWRSAIANPTRRSLPQHGLAGRQQRRPRLHSRGGAGGRLLCHRAAAVRGGGRNNPRSRAAGCCNVCGRSGRRCRSRSGRRWCRASRRRRRPAHAPVNSGGGHWQRGVPGRLCQGGGCKRRRSRVGGR